MRNLCTICILFAALLFPGAVSQTAELTPDKSVLLVWGNPYIGPWEQNYNQIVVRELALGQSAPVLPEFLSLLNASESEKALIAESLSLKYSRSDVDLVIAVQVEASDFVYHWQHMFAPDAQILYVLPGDALRDEIVAANAGNVLGSAAGEAITNTVQIIPQLLPDLKQLYVVGGSSAGDVAYLGRFKQAIENSNFAIDTTYLSGLSPDELVAVLKTAPRDSALLMGTYNVDDIGQLHRTVDVAQKLVEESSFPIFGVFDALIGVGLLGGSVTSSGLYAEETLEVVFGLLADNQFNRTSTSATTYMFDAKQLARFGISRRDLPPGSLVINEIPSLWKDYGIELSVLGGVIFVQLVLIVLLLNSMRRRKLAESALQEVKKLDALGDLASGIAHDLNNILTAVVGNAEVAKLSANDPVEVTTYTNNILLAADRAGRLVSQISMFGRGVHEDMTDAVSPLKIIDEVILQLQASSPDTLSVEVRAGQRLWTMKASETQIYQALMNLCVNAGYAMDNSGKIVIFARNTTIAEPTKLYGMTIPAGDYVSISVIDTGSGIDKKILARIFEPFYTTKPRGKGSGLGLALVHRIIRNHDAYLDIESEREGGTTVTLYFNAFKLALEPQLNRASPVSGRSDNQLILLVDDDEAVLSTYENLLVQLGFRVEAYSNPIEALAQFTANPEKFDLLITDFSMPEMDGAKLTLEITKLRAGLPVILCTGYANSLDGRALHDIQNFKLLHKPFSKEKILDAVLHSLLNK